MTALRRPGRRQGGQAIVLIAIMLAVLIGMVALAIDGSRGYAMRRDMQAAIDAASLAAGDSLQRGSGYSSAEQAATNVFASNLRLYGSPSCTPYGTPGASALTVTCTFSDGTVLTQTISNLGAQGTSFSLRATRQVPLQFGRILTNGGIPTLAAVSAGSVNNLVYAPVIAALDEAGCGGTGGTALSVNGTGTLSVVGDVVSNGAVSVPGGAMSVGGDVYARCQSSVAGLTNACYPSGSSLPCTYPDRAGATRSGFHAVDPGYPAPQLGGTQGAPNGNVNLLAGIYTSLPGLSGHHCWFLGGGVYDWQLGLNNQTDLLSNELKPPAEPNPTNNTVLSANQFWDSDGVNCAGSYEVERQAGGDGEIPTGNWAFVVTSTRTDTYGGVTYTRESAPSMCDVVNLNPHFNDAQISISNVPGATGYNVYAAPPNNGCSGPFGLAMSVPVSGSVLNTNTNPCPAFTGNGCTLGHETADLGPALEPPFAPNAAAAPGTTGAYPPDAETAPLAAGLPNENPARGSGTTGDRANENHCATAAGTAIACPSAVTPGAVELYVPVGGCLATSSNAADTYVFSGYQYDWIAAYEPAANTCANTLGGGDNSAYVGLFYAPGSTVSVSSALSFESPGTGGVMADRITFTGGLPSISYSGAYAPVPPASRLAS